MSYFYSRENVKKFQARLKELGFDPGKIDGWNGTRTEAAVKAFQASRGLTVDGDVGPRTWSYLFDGKEPVSEDLVPSYKAGGATVKGWSIVNHRLYKDGKPVTFKQTPNTSSMSRARYLVHHFTAGSYAGAVSWLLQRQAKASAHIVVGENGEVTQLAPFNVATWHAGRSYWKGINGLNRHSIGIEIANYGQLSGSKGNYKALGKIPVPDDRVYVGRHPNGGPVTGWHTYTDAQLEAVEAISKVLHATYGFEDLLGHEQIAPGRKTDPGAAYPLQQMRDAVIGRRKVAMVMKEDRSDAPKTQQVVGASMATGFGALSEPVAEAAQQLEPLSGMSEVIRYIFLGLTVLGIGLFLYGRWKDMKRAEPSDAGA